MANKPCLTCGRPSPRSRCGACAPTRTGGSKRGLDRTHYRLRRTLIDEWVATHGWICPGYQRDPHPVQVGQLSADHIKPRSLYPELMHEPSNYAILCLTCNKKKGRKLA